MGHTKSLTLTSPPVHFSIATAWASVSILRCPESHNDSALSEHPMAFAAWDCVNLFCLM